MNNDTAHKLGIQLPVPQEQIESTVERLLVVLTQIHQAEQATKKLLDMVREDCSHPEKAPVANPGQLRNSRCTTCGKVW